RRRSGTNADFRRERRRNGCPNGGGEAGRGRAPGMGRALLRGGADASGRVARVGRGGADRVRAHDHHRGGRPPGGFAGGAETLRWGGVGGVGNPGFWTAYSAV